MWRGTGNECHPIGAVRVRTRGGSLGRRGVGQACQWTGVAAAPAPSMGGRRNLGVAGGMERESERVGEHLSGRIYAPSEDAGVTSLLW